MEEVDLDKIIEKLESKRNDCVSFSKKYKIREMDDLFQYYEDEEKQREMCYTLY